MKLDMYMDCECAYLQIVYEILFFQSAVTNCVDDAET